MQDTDIIHITVNPLNTLFLGCIVLLLGRILNKRIPFLEEYHIPKPVTGGIVAAIVIAIIYYTNGIQFNFDKNLSNAFMLLFFASIGLSADFKKLFAGGKGLILLLISAILMVLTQDVIGPVLAKFFGIDHRYGVLAGSVTLVGGHGTGGAWAAVLENAADPLPNATAIAFACATYGLIAGGLIGGPVAQFLIKRKNLTANVRDDEHDAFEDNEVGHLIKVSSVTEGFICLAVTMYGGIQLHEWVNSFKPVIELPTFVYVIFTGIILRTILTSIFDRELKEVTIDVLGNVFLALFLAISLLSVQIWTLTGLALPITAILLVQTVVVIIYTVFFTFNFLGKNYDSAIICAGQCGFSLGATPTAIANMQSVTNHFGPSHKAFLLVPLVGSFFIDLINALIINWSINIF